MDIFCQKKTKNFDLRIEVFVWFQEDDGSVFVFNATENNRLVG